MLVIQVVVPHSSAFCTGKTYFSSYRRMKLDMYAIYIYIPRKKYYIPVVKLYWKISVIVLFLLQIDIENSIYLKRFLLTLLYCPSMFIQYVCGTIWHYRNTVNLLFFYEIKYKQQHYSLSLSFYYFG